MNYYDFVKDTRNTQLYKGLADIAVLAAVLDQARYGLEILSEVSTNAGIELGEGTIYPLLHRLEKDALIKSRWKLDTPNGRPRKYYECTAQGREALTKKVALWRSTRTKLDRFLEGIEL